MTHTENPYSFNLNCPLPFSESDKILLAHGGGGSMSARLIEQLFFTTFGNQNASTAHDGAIFEAHGKIAISTDSFVVNPIFFPGGNIGELAVNGTVNDLACCGAIPKFLTLAFIIEEGLLISELWQIVQSIKKAADESDVQIITGDTKVVERGKGDKIFINTTGIGFIEHHVEISPQNAQPGDVIIINGTMADHGIAILLKREGLEFESQVQSDTAALNHLVKKLLDNKNSLHVMRDPTRGGLSSVLNEIARSSGVEIILFENQIPILEQTRAACELLGFDPLYVANEGKILFFVPENEASEILEIMHNDKNGKRAAIIGKVEKKGSPMVKLRTSLGTTRIVDMISGEQLPRIC
jgi:hydrogenase expression/formation protein HypE